MIKNYLKFALRNIMRNKIYSFINIIGLAIGLTGFVLISILINNETSYDSFQTKANRIYRAVEIQKQENIGNLKIAVTMGPLAKALKEYFPSVEQTARMMPFATAFYKVGNKGFYENDISLADPSLFDIFTIPFIEGDPSNALKNPYSMVITREMAEKYFGNEDPLNKSIRISSWMGVNDFLVTGVIEDYPKNSFIYFKGLISFVTMENRAKWLENWNNNSLATYILLKDKADPKQLDSQMPQFVQRYIPPDKNTGQRSNLRIYLQSIKDIHLYSDDIVYQTFNHNKGSLSTVILFSTIALFILLIACVNFMNLATARSSKRIKEISMRKILGATRITLIKQFIGEALVISIGALIISLIMVIELLPYFKDIFEGRIISSDIFSIKFIFELIGITLFVGLLSGSYPAFFLSKFKAINSSKASISGASKGKNLRRVLVIFQFTTAISLIVCTGIVMDQMNFVQNKDLGFNKEQVIYLPILSKNVKSKVDILKNELLKNPNVISTAAGSGLTGASNSEGTEIVAGAGQRVTLMMRKSFVDFDYLKTMEMQIVKGRGFSRNMSLDSTSSVIINEAAVRKFGWSDPIGKQFEGDPVKTVIGVVKDFNFFNLHSEIGPLIMSVDKSWYNFVLIRVKPDKISGTISYIEDAWKKIIPGEPFDYSFLDQHFDEVYKNDQQTGQIFGFFSGFAIFIACLGIFGLAAFTAEQKTKEIGVRKVLGASVYSVVYLLCKDFIALVIAAAIIAVPLSYYLMNSWLEDFAYRVNINWLIFAISGGIAILIAFTTVSYQAVKAANANPIKALRYE